MRVLFILSGAMWTYTLPEGLRELGHQVEITGCTTEENLRQVLGGFGPDFVMCIGWGVDQTLLCRNIISKCTKEANIPLVYWSIEDPAFTEEFSIPLIRTMKPDFVFCQSAETTEDFKAMGIKAAYMDFGYAPMIHHYFPDKSFQSDIAVVANVYPDVLQRQPYHYRRQAIQNLVVPLLKENIRIDFWGRDWESASEYVGQDIPREWLHDPIPYRDANRIYSSAKIVLGLQNYTSQVTQRTYEILASGGFLITCDTPGVRKLFEPDRELVVSASPQQTAALVKYYLKDSAKRLEISRQGQSRVRKESYTKRAKYMLKVLGQAGILSTE